VLNLLYYDVDTLRLVLIERSVNPRDRHSGQVGFPGGRFEPSDGSLESVALREAEEEIGVPAGSVQILGRLTALYIPVSNYLVHPFVGFAERLPELKPQPGEVEQIITPALDFFRKPETRQSKDVVLDSGVTLKAVPCFHVEDKIIWGATAMILNEFLELLGDGSAC
jgi:8-oxo-dGTP pyrophosphatase MutT (NUDIX family)